MKIKEIEPSLEVILFDEASEYDKFLKEHGIEYSLDSRAKGIANPDGTFTVAIDRSYYLHGGILPEQLQAIVIHEEVEDASSSDDPHLDGTIAEYTHILDNFGVIGLKQYHSNLCNLMGGINDTRNQALKIVLMDS